MNALILILITLGISAQSVTKKAYNNKLHGGRFFFSAVTSFISGALFLIMGIKGFSVDLELVLYSFCFAVFFGMGLIFSFLAIASGPLSLTSLISSFSLLIPTFYGLIFLDEQIGSFFFIGLGLLAASLILINTKKDNTTASLKWAIFVILSFIGNGTSATVQKMQQIAYEGYNKNEFMCIALFFTAIFFTIMTFAKEKQHIKQNARSGWGAMLICGAANCFGNLLLMILSNSMPASIMFPLISAGGIILSTMVSIFIYKEKLSSPQFIGLIFGIGSVIFLNI